MKVNIVMSGSSTKFPIHLGFIWGLKKSGIEINEAVGTSGGGMVLALVKSGMDIEEVIQKTYEVSFTDYVSLNWWKYFIGYFRGFFVKNRKLIEFFKKLTNNKLLKDVEKLSLVAVDLEQDKTIELSGLKYPDVSVAVAIMATICIPGFFEPVILDSMYLVDGGIRENIGIDFIRDEMHPTIVVIVNSTPTITGLYRNLFEVWMDSIDNLFNANQEKAVREGRRRNFYITEISYNLPFNQFDVSLDMKRNMVELGYNKAIEVAKTIKL